MKFTHEYVNSFGVVVAILVAFSSVVERTPAIPIIEGGSNFPTKPTIVERAGSQLYLTTNHKGSFSILNTNSQTAHISLRYLAISDCRIYFPMRSTYAHRARSQRLNPVVIFPTDADAYWKTSEVLPGQLLDIPWEVNIQRPPDRFGQICAIVSTLLADGSQFTARYQIGIFLNEFNEESLSINLYPAREALAHATIVERGQPTVLRKDEVDYLLKTGDINGPDFRFLSVKQVAVPERTCFSFFAWRWCKIGSYSY